MDATGRIGKYTAAKRALRSSGRACGTPLDSNDMHGTDP